jgi:hypothetical protein
MKEKKKLFVSSEKNEHGNVMKFTYESENMNFIKKELKKIV